MACFPCVSSQMAGRLRSWVSLYLPIPTTKPGLSSHQVKTAVPEIGVCFLCLSVCVCVHVCDGNRKSQQIRKVQEAAERRLAETSDVAVLMAEMSLKTQRMAWEKVQDAFEVTS